MLGFSVSALSHSPSSANELNSPLAERDKVKIESNSCTDAFLTTENDLWRDIDSVREIVLNGTEGRSLSRLISQIDEQDIKIAKRLGKPSVVVEVGPSFNASQTSFDLAPSTSIDGLNTQARLNLSLPIYSGGRNKLALKRARIEKRANETRELNRQNDLSLEGALAYIRVAGARIRSSLAVENLETFIRLEAILIERFNVGQASGTDLAQAKSSIASARSLLENAKGQLQIRIVELEGIAPGISRLACSLPTPNPERYSNRSGYLDSGRQNLQQMEAYLRATTATVDVEIEKRRYFPTLLAFGGLTRSTAPVNFGSATGLGAVTDNRETLNQVVGVNLRFPLYEGGRRSQRLKQVRFEEKLAKQTAALQVRRVETQKMTANLQLQTDFRRLEANNDAVKTAEFAVAGISEQVKAGLTSSFELLNAQERLNRARIEKAQTVEDLYSSEVTYLSLIEN